MTSQSHHHFLLVTIGAQGQINPARRLARRLARAAASPVTISIPLYSHRRMFPSSTSDAPVIDEHEPLVSYATYSDGYDQGYNPNTDDVGLYISKLHAVGPQTLARVASSFSRPVTCVIYTLLTDWAAAVTARDLGVPAILFWIQPATVFTLFYRYFHVQGVADAIASHRNDPSFTVNLEGLPPLRIRDLPSFMADESSPFHCFYIDAIKAVDKEKERVRKPRVLVNTFHALEAAVIAANDELDMIPVGPLMIEATSRGNDLFKEDETDYMEWLDAKEERSVVYIAFGSLTAMEAEQIEEIRRGLTESGRPYLWVVRKDIREKVGVLEMEVDSDKGMVVDWCNQMRVLSHRAVGCFVTHGGWNSTTESITCGVPMVVKPGWMDQQTNARMVEGVWGVGVRAEVNGKGVMEAEEVKRCLDVVMGEGEKGVEIRRKAEILKGKAREAAQVSTESLISFVNTLAEGYNCM